jgi:carboxyl-terminal processing protease
VRVVQFQEQTAASLVQHLDKLVKQGEMKGLVLDLRNDPGGLLHGAVGVSAAFLPPKALVVSTDGRADDSKRKYLAVPEDYLRGSRDDFIRNVPASIKTVPMVVLVNGGSASASEIVAGALQDHKRAVVMGTQSFGKGSVQTILPLNSNAPSSSPRPATSRPAGARSRPRASCRTSSSRKRRVALPAIACARPISTATSAMARSPSCRRRSKRRCRPRKTAPKGKDKDKPKDEAEEAKPPFEIAGKDDYQLAQAVNLLKGLQILQNNAK